MNIGEIEKGLNKYRLLVCKRETNEANRQYYLRQGTARWISETKTRCEICDLNNDLLCFEDYIGAERRTYSCIELEMLLSYMQANTISWIARQERREANV